MLIFVFEKSRPLLLAKGVHTEPSSFLLRGADHICLRLYQLHLRVVTMNRNLAAELSRHYFREVARIRSQTVS